MHFLRKVYYLILLLHFTFFVAAQKSDSSFFKVSYNFYFKPDSTKADKHYDLLVLEIGDNTSYCYSYYAFLREKEIKEQFALQQKMGSAKIIANTGSSRRGINVRFYRDLNSGCIRFIDLVGLDWYFVEDSLTDLHWEISTDTLTIQNFLCYKATTRFRGRKWNAWFTDRIPIAAGPMKFGGLPGLILKVEDEKDNFSFVCTSMESLYSKNLIEIPKLSYIRTSNSKYKGIKINFLKNPGAFMLGTTMEIKQDDSMSNTPIQSRPLVYNPMELE